MLTISVNIPIRIDRNPCTFLICYSSLSLVIQNLANSSFLVSIREAKLSDISFLPATVEVAIKAPITFAACS